MTSLYRILFALLLSLIVAVPVHSQWDPFGDVNLFSYVFPYPGRYINDHCLIRADSLWHLYFIDGEISKEKWDREGNEVRIGHATSPDLLHWRPRDSALGVGPPGSLDAAHVYAPSVIEMNGTYYMFYTGNQSGYVHGEHLFLATSTDLYKWKRFRPEPIFVPDTSWAVHHPPGYKGGAGGPASGRDPFIFYDERYGYILYYVALLRSTTEGVKDGTYSCIAAATSGDLVNWTDRGPLVIRETKKAGQGVLWNHPESPDLVRRGDIYYLFWKGGPGTRYVMSRNPLDFTGAEEHRLATSHASKIIEWGEEWYVTSCSRELSDIAHRQTDRSRGLYLARIRWEGAIPRVSPLPATVRMPQPAAQPDEASLSPNPVERGESVSIRLPAGSSAGEYDVSVVDVRSTQVFRGVLRAFVDEHGTRSVEIATAALSPGVYFVRAGGSLGRLVVL